MNKEAQPMDFNVTISYITQSHWVLWYKFKAPDVNSYYKGKIGQEESWHKEKANPIIMTAPLRDPGLFRYMNQSTFRV